MKNKLNIDCVVFSKRILDGLDFSKIAHELGLTNREVRQSFSRQKQRYDSLIKNNPHEKLEEYINEKISENIDNIYQRFILLEDRIKILEKQE